LALETLKFCFDEACLGVREKWDLEEILFNSFNKHSMILYDNYSRADLIKLINCKNKKIDSQRSMLNQLRVRRDSLNKEVNKRRKIEKENKRLRIEKIALLSRINTIMTSGRGKAWSLKEHAPFMMNAILGFHKLRKEGNVTSNEIAFLILGYQKEVFTLNDIQTFNKKWGRNPDFRWRSDFKDCCEANLFHSSKYGRRTIYFISWKGMARIEALLKNMYVRQ